jgi:hypothetical protein
VWDLAAIAVDLLTIVAVQSYEEENEMEDTEDKPDLFQYVNPKSGTYAN